MAYQNFYASKLYAAIGSSDTTITVETPPNITSGYAVIEARNATKREIIKFTGVSGTQLTGVTRGVGETDATDHVKNALIEINVVAENLEELEAQFQSYVATTSDWRDAGTSISSVTYNGNRSYTVVTSTDKSNILSPGHRLRLTRNTAAPTQSTSLNGTNQYWSKTSPAGMTFTDDFTVSAWVKLSSYGSFCVIAGRDNGTSGWDLAISSSGQPQIIGYNGGYANYRSARAYQSIPLNKWVHISAQLDMSSYTATATTCYVMIDGVDVPVELISAGTNPTALVQAGNLEIGSRNGGSAAFFPGKIAQVAIFSAKVTQATMRGYMSQGILGTETSLISAYSFNGTPNDLAATANNLTAVNAAGYTTDSPFAVQATGTPNGTLDYGIIQKVDGTTLTVQVPEGCTLPTTGGVSTLDYSTMRSPYGFPGQRDKWAVRTVMYSDTTFAVGSAASTYFAFGGLSLTVPQGNWSLKLSISVIFQGSTAAAILGRVCMSSTSGAVAVGGTIVSPDLTDYYGRYGGASGTEMNVYHEATSFFNASTPTICRAGFRMEGGGGTFSIRHTGSALPKTSYIEAENAYL